MIQVVTNDETYSNKVNATAVRDPTTTKRGFDDSFAGT